MEMLWSATDPNHRPIPFGAPRVDYEFPSGVAHVEIIPETSKLDVNASPPVELYRLGLALGLEPEKAREIATAIDEWRRPAESPLFDGYYLSLTPSFRPPHASFQEIEELLLVKGVSPDIYYGTYAPATEQGGPRLTPRTGLADCLSVFGSRDRFDANTAPPAVLAAVGLSADDISALLERRRTAPLTREDLMGFLNSIGSPGARLRVGGNSIFLIRATAQPRLANGAISDLKRTVAARVKYMPTSYDSPIHVLRWYDSAWSN
jgi:general secretion pathway protein K